VSALQWDDLLVGEPGRQWRTVTTSRRVLVIVHNVTAATRLLDIVPLWANDSRVQTAFTLIGSSAFTTGTAEFLHSRGITPISWERATTEDFTVAISASYGGPQHEVRAPLIIFPHGMGYNKYLRKPGNQETRKPGNPVFGLSDAWLLHEGEVVPTLAVLSHDEQRKRLGDYCPEAVPAAFVAGDPCFDRMLAARPLRETYRHRFGVRRGQRVVVISSTWGATSLFGQDPDLVLRLARELPLDEYRILVALHPNIWHGHSPWQVRTWLADCARAGATVLPPDEGWRAALVAADVTVGDQGSVTFYSAALGTPVLLASSPQDTVDPASPIAALLRTAPRFDAHDDLRGQLDDVIRDHSASRYAAITELTTSAPGESARLLRTAIYTQLGLDEPATPADSPAVPLPEVDCRRVPSQLVQVLLEERDGALVAATTRRPAAALTAPSTVPADAILVASTEEPNRRWLELAEVLVDDGPGHRDPRQWIQASLAALPGCLLGAARDCAGDWLVTGADLPAVWFRGDPGLGPVCAALLHAWLREGRAPQDLPAVARIELGRRAELVRIEIAPAEELHGS
jgi:hypothetical protein